MSKKKNVKKKDGVSLNDFKKVVGAEKVEVVDFQKNRERLIRLITGKEKPANEFVEYLLTQVTATAANLDSITKQIDTLSHELALLKDKARSLSNAHEKYLHDVTQWWDK
jgi:hypothetical protein